MRITTDNVENKHAATTEIRSALLRMQALVDAMKVEERSAGEGFELELARLRHDLSIVTREQLFWENLKFSGAQQRFLVCRLGSSGSVFLAKLLGAHPDVFCSHEGILWNHRDLAASQGVTEQEAFLQYICSDEMHDAYKASGDIGSAWISYLHCAPRSFTSLNVPLRTGVLHRHPLRVLKTQRHIYANEPVTRPADALEAMVEYFEEHGIRCDVAGVGDDASVNFIWTCYLWREAAIKGRGLDVQIHVEKLNDIDYAQNILLSLTGIHYQAELISPLLGKVVNSRTGDVETVNSIWSKMPPQFQHWYSIIVEDVANSIGYTRTP